MTASSEKSPSRICFSDATTIVKNSKKDETRVNSPATIKSAPIDSEKEAINPKKMEANSKPIKSGSACPSLSHLADPEVILPIP